MSHLGSGAMHRLGCVPTLPKPGDTAWSGALRLRSAPDLNACATVCMKSVRLKRVAAQTPKPWLAILAGTLPQFRSRRPQHKQCHRLPLKRVCGSRGSQEPIR